MFKGLWNKWVLKHIVDLCGRNVFYVFTEEWNLYIGEYKHIIKGNKINLPNLQLDYITNLLSIYIEYGIMYSKTPPQVGEYRS